MDVEQQNIIFLSTTRSFEGSNNPILYYDDGTVVVFDSSSPAMLYFLSPMHW